MWRGPLSRRRGWWGPAPAPTSPLTSWRACLEGARPRWRPWRRGCRRPAAACSWWARSGARGVPCIALRLAIAPLWPPSQPLARTVLSNCLAGTWRSPASPAAPLSAKLPAVMPRAPSSARWWEPPRQPCASSRLAHAAALSPRWPPAWRQRCRPAWRGSLLMLCLLRHPAPVWLMAALLRNAAACARLAAPSPAPPRASAQPRCRPAARYPRRACSAARRPRAPLPPPPSLLLLGCGCRPQARSS